MLIVKSKVRELAKAQDMSFSADADEELSKAVEEILKKAIERAKDNGRKTIKARDI